MKFSVDSAAVGDAAIVARNSASVIRGEVTAMMGHLLALQGVWTGAASVAFEGLAQRWQATQAQVETALDQISLALDATSATYAEAETQSTRMFSM